MIKSKPNHHKTSLLTVLSVIQLFNGDNSLLDFTRESAWQVLVHLGDKFLVVRDHEGGTRALLVAWLVVSLGFRI